MPHLRKCNSLSFGHFLKRSPTDRLNIKKLFFLGFSTILYEKQTEFVQNASHELRTPLTIIQAKQELLLTEPNKKIIEKSEDINLTLKETRRLIKLIKELMELARADNKKIKIEKQSTDINELIKEIVKPYVELAKIGRAHV